MVTKVTFVGFRGDDRPNGPSLDQPLSAPDYVVVTVELLS